MKKTPGTFHYILILLVFLRFWTLESKNDKTRGNFRVIFISVFILLSFCWFSCISGPWKAKMKKNPRKFSFYCHLCFHCIFSLLVFLHFGALESKNEKTRGNVHVIFLFAGFGTHSGKHNMSSTHETYESPNENKTKTQMKIK